MKLLKKAGIFLILFAFLIIPITSYAVTTTVTNETMQSDIYYILTFNANTSDPVENLPQNIDAGVGEIIIIPNQIPTRTGYTFSGWNTYQDGSGTQYQPGSSFAELYQDSTLYAQWDEYNSPIIIVIIIGILFLLILISIIFLAQYYIDDNC